MNNFIEEQLIHLWGKVGFITHLSQMVEYNLANIIALDRILREFKDTDSMFVIKFNDVVKESNEIYKELSKKPLGYILKEARKIKYFTIESEKLLKRAIKKRNYVTHKMFKEDLGKNYLETNPKYYYSRLENTIELLKDINDSLCEIFKSQKEEYNLIW